MQSVFYITFFSLWALKSECQPQLIMQFKNTDGYNDNTDELNDQNYLVAYQYFAAIIVENWQNFLLLYFLDI